MNEVEVVKEPVVVAEFDYENSYTNKAHQWKGGSGKPFRANCTVCGERKQRPIHAVYAGDVKE